MFVFSHIILMLADDMACNARNPRPGKLLNTCMSRKPRYHIGLTDIIFLQELCLAMQTNKQMFMEMMLKLTTEGMRYRHLLQLLAIISIIALN